MIQSQKDVLLREIAHVSMQQARHPEDSFFYIAHGGRLVALRRELAALEETTPETARVAITFNGQSITGSEGIGVGVVTKTMQAFQKVIGLLVGVVEGIAPTPSGRPRSGSVDHLQLVNLAYGSFGYELESRYPDGFFSTAHTSRAIDQAMDLLRDAATDERAFLEEVETYPPQLIAKLKEFVYPVKRD